MQMKSQVAYQTRRTFTLSKKKRKKKKKICMWLKINVRKT